MERRTSDERFAQHRGLVVAIANQLAARYRLRRFYDDLLAFGDTGLLEALDRFDASRGAAFSTYAWYIIRGRMLDGCREMGLVAPRRRGEALAEACYADVRATHLETQDDDKPDPADGASWDAMTHDLDEMVTAAGAIFLLLDEDDERLDVADTAPSPEASSVALSVQRFVRAQLDTLDQELRLVLEMSFYQDKSLDEIGAVLDCSRSWASRLRSTALRALAARLRAHGGEP